MIAFANEELKRMERQLYKVTGESDNIIEIAARSMEVIVQSIQRLKEELVNSPFGNTGEEIMFFKMTKPRFTSQFVYWSEVSRIESKRPVGSGKVQTKYLTKQLDKLANFFDDNMEFYQYYRHGNTYFDEKYFVRNVYDVRLQTDVLIFDYDPTFSTSHDHKVARILANEQLRVYLTEAIDSIAKKRQSEESTSNSGKSLVWTASRAALVELLYGLHACGVFNDSNADLRQIAIHLEAVFGKSLGNYYRAFQEIQIRKSGRTNFIDQMKKKLIEKMDEADEG